MWVFLNTLRDFFADALWDLFLWLLGILPPPPPSPPPPGQPTDAWYAYLDRQLDLSSWEMVQQLPGVVWYGLWDGSSFAWGLVAIVTSFGFCYWRGSGIPVNLGPAPPPYIIPEVDPAAVPEALAETWRHIEGDYATKVRLTPCDVQPPVSSEPPELDFDFFDEPGPNIVQLGLDLWEVITSIFWP